MNRSALSIALAALFCGAWLLPRTAHAFCGFYASSAGGKLYNDATQVVMMRDGDKTVLSMRNTYQGPPEDFAMVVPVPEVLKKEDVKTLDDAIFERVDHLTAPRLVEYWQRNPCREEEPTRTKFYNFDDMLIDGDFRPQTGESYIPPKVAATFAVGEYEIVILSAKESNGLEKWLFDNGYNIPKGASKALAPYIAQGMYFFVAKVNARKIKFDSKGNALLSPLRFYYKSKDLSLPVRLGLLNAKGPQDLLVHILSREGRHQVANRANAFIPTDLLAPADAKDHFDGFYEEIFAYTQKQKPGAVITEYAWGSNMCDPCPTEPLGANDLLALGADIVDGLKTRVEMRVRMDFVIAEDVEDMGYHAVAKDFVRVISYGEGWHGCYGELLEQTPNQSGHVKFHFTINRRGNVEEVTFLERQLGDERFERCLRKYLMAIERGPRSERDNSYTAQVEFAMHHAIEATDWAPRGWTLTRLHARYTAKTMTEDLIFEKAAPIEGGRDMPRGASGELPDAGIEASHSNRFQGRYIILHPWGGEVTCDEHERYISWRGEARPGGNFGKRKTTTTPRSLLSKELKQQIREQLQQPLPSMRTSR